MNSKQFKLEISKPCQQQWKSMGNIDGGKFCSTCSKTVLDLTQKSDAELYNILRGNNKVCAKLTTEQIDTNKYLPVESYTKFSFSNILASIMFIGLVDNALSSPNTIFSKAHPVIQTDNLKIKTNEQTVISDTLKVIIEGKVIDKTSKEAIPFTTVAVQNSNFQVITDINGIFNLALPNTKIDNQITLLVNVVGYKSFKQTIYKKNFPLKNLEIQLNSDVILGDVCIVVKKRWWKFW